jgi:thymidylate synthase
MERQYHQLLRDILLTGEQTTDRTGTGTLSIFGYQSHYDLSKGFPAVTTKKLAWRSVVAELLWFLEGSTDERRLAELTYGKEREALVGKRTIWTANADVQGVDLGHYNDDYIKELGPVYGAQWRRFSYFTVNTNGVDQISNVIKEIKKNPDSRRLVVSAWNPMLMHDMALPPCHVLFQFRVMNRRLHCQMYQRSADAMLGIPFNIASYALLTHMIARECNLEVGTLVHTIGDAHIYTNHIEQVKEQISREHYPLPTLQIDDSFDLQSRLTTSRFELADVDMFTLLNYEHHPFIAAPMAV